ncbi:uncharacterized protein N7496_001894 [Penicillium cataractarum]|uniref:Uncharacterized protein n=1 Tax=Penicillium cataractarum TaxID=2100454 RepID=A0A9W9VWT9_9EURO|nr:uncharacterized protein N7496_001894 [Penicillium cataractarum]KAJ5390826.1 hypothetical protein N7496_001894 [Penicillium cataractarum]
MSKTGVTEMETTTALPPAKRSFGARLGAHFKKWWWVHLIIFIAVLLIILLPVVYVAYPKIAQSQVNDSTLNVTSMVIADPTPDSFHLTQTQVIGSHSSYHPKIYSFLASVSLLGAASAFTSVQVPEVQSKDGAEVNVDQVVDLSNADAFGDFAQAVMLNEEVEMNIYGRPGLKEGGLPKTTVTYNKTVTMKGLNKLNGFDVTDFHILLETQNGRNMNGTVYIPNPSVMTITMGNVTLDLSVAGIPMGYSYLDNLVLKPGNNTVPMTSTVNESAIITMVTSSSNPYKDGMVPFTITGNSSVYNGKQLPYFTQALAANNLTVSLNVTKALAEIGIKL